MKATLFVLVLLPAISVAQPLNAITFPNVIVSEITSIYDGDTFRVNINSYPKIIGHRMSVRVNGIDTPELKAKCSKEKVLALKAKDYTVSALRNSHKIELKGIKRGKYFRLLADVYIDGESLARSLVLNGLAVEYHGGTKSNWCR